MPPSMPNTSDPDYTIGALATLQETPVELPAFVSKRSDGLYIDPAQTEPTQFLAFTELCFNAGKFFRQLDYARFVALLYEEPAKLRVQYPAPMRFADEIATFAPERLRLYRQIKIVDGEAIYLFDPAYLETVVEEPVIGDLPDGTVGVLRIDQRTVSEPASLDVDEFVAVAWQQGIRFGIDHPAVVDAMLHSKADRIVVARPRAVIPGKDAEIKPETSNLKRSNAPKKLQGGRIDLTQFENRHPQVTTGLRLFKKIPRQAGEDGREISGKLIPAPPPADADLTHCCGTGTEIINEPDGECLITTAAGFLNIDKASGEVSITDKIISREGVSIRTTGDLVLDGEEYEEYGEIQEKRTVKCHSITTHADVFGNIVSNGGLVLLKRNLVGGNASNAQGDICIEGVSSGATLIAPEGCIRVKKAESSLLIAREVHIEEAIRCDILAEKIVIENVESSALAGRQLEITHARSTHGIDNVFSLLIPDLSAFQAKRAQLLEDQATINGAISQLSSKMASLREDKEISQYMQIATKVQRKELSLNPEQMQRLKILAAKVAPDLRTLSQINENLHTLQDGNLDVQAQLEELDANMQNIAVGIDCTVGLIDGDTRIRSLAIKIDAPPLDQLPVKELRLRLRATDGAIKPLLSADSGKFDWHYADN
jgi:uncharacterized protein